MPSLFPVTCTSSPVSTSVVSRVARALSGALPLVDASYRSSTWAPTASEKGHAASSRCSGSEPGRKAAYFAGRVCELPASGVAGTLTWTGSPLTGSRSAICWPIEARGARGCGNLWALCFTSSVLKTLYFNLGFSQHINTRSSNQETPKGDSVGRPVPGYCS